MVDYTPKDVLGAGTMERFCSDDAKVIVDRIVKNAKEAWEKVKAVEEEVKKAAEDLKKI